jgi:hypothetical protein
LANIQHKDIIDGQRHEPKGISTATNKQVYVADGSAGGAWSKVGPISLSGITTNGTAGQFVSVDGTGNFVLASAAHGSIYFYNVGAPYTLTYPATATKVAPTTTVKTGSVLITGDTSGRLTYTGPTTASLDIVFSASADQAIGATRDIEFSIYKNGVVVPGSQSIVTTTSGEKHHFAVHADVLVSTSDYLEVYCKNYGASGDVRIYTFTLFATTSGA